MGTTLSFVASWRGRRCDFPGGAGGQCVDLANQYLSDVLHLGAHHANAAEWQSAVLPGMRWVANGPVNAPPLGAIVVWHMWAAEQISSLGHIAIAVASEPMHFLSFDQNWPDGAVCSLVMHDYGGVAGWFQLAG